MTLTSWTAPLMFMVGIFFGLYNLIDSALYKLASPFEPTLFASHPRLYHLHHMLLLLLLRPLVELASVVLQPYRIYVGRQESRARAALEIPLALLRTVIAIVAVPVGILGLTARRLDLAVARAMRERQPSRVATEKDVVAEARRRRGRVEAERMAVERAESGEEPIGDEVLRRWDERFGRRHDAGEKASGIGGPSE